MICPECKAAGITSCVYAGAAMSTLMVAHAFYDEAGAWHNHDRNVTSRTYTCTNGHEWVHGTTPDCPTCGVSWRVKE